MMIHDEVLTFDHDNVAQGGGATIFYLCMGGYTAKRPLDGELAALVFFTVTCIQNYSLLMVVMGEGCSAYRGGGLGLAPCRCLRRLLEADLSGPQVAHVLGQNGGVLCLASTGGHNQPRQWHKRQHTW